MAECAADGDGGVVVGRLAGEVRCEWECVWEWVGADLMGGRRRASCGGGGGGKGLKGGGRVKVRACFREIKRRGECPKSDRVTDAVWRMWLFESSAAALHPI